ncbi:peptidoglycan DD-metalloendopeptidase family protein [Brevibacillus sp. SYSU BS000544]|uniref:peptidoglycan DD-metalloendopeptidase family protein n=1 Tax=Brevibacillus sp. SYSU BS000544 TaxID=3416443 RepID=UPI003CE4B5A6
MNELKQVKTFVHCAVLVSCIALTTGCNAISGILPKQNTSQPPATSPSQTTEPGQTTPTAPTNDTTQWVKLPIKQINGANMVSLQQLAKVGNFSPKIDQFEGTVAFSYLGQSIEFLKGSPTVSINGLFESVPASPVFEKADVYIPVDFVATTIGDEMSAFDANKQTLLIDPKSNQAVPVNASKREINLDQAKASELITYLNFLELPLKGAKVSTRDSQMPNAPRPYRNGTHEGLDWYEGSSGPNIAVGTPVYSMSDGKVVRSDLGYQELSLAARDEILKISAESPRTPLWILDKLRGRTVWVQYDHGVMVRYAHLNDIPKTIVPGVTVKKGQLIGYVGNSGTSYGVEKSKEGAHLHSDILIYGELFWKKLNKQEIRHVLEAVFNTPPIKK